MKLHPDVVAIKRAAPKWANWFVGTGGSGDAWYINKLEGGFLWWWGAPGRKWQVIDKWCLPRGNPFAINLRNGDIHVEDEARNVAVVPQSAWVAARKRKQRK